MATGNTYPAPLGPGFSYSGLGAGVTTPNFVLDPGLYTISVEFYDTNATGDQVLFQSVSGSTTTTQLTINYSGYYNFVVPPGASTTYNFTTTNGARNVRANRIDLSIGPS